MNDNDNTTQVINPKCMDCTNEAVVICKVCNLAYCKSCFYAHGVYK